LIAWILITGLKHQIDSAIKFAASIGQVLALIKTATQLEGFSAFCIVESASDRRRGTVVGVVSVVAGVSAAR
jgi:hypothetical protein